MRTRTLLILWTGLLLAALLSGCSTPSLNPVYCDQTVSTQPEIVGEWKLPSESATYRVDSLGSTNYRLTVTTEEGQTKKVMTFDLHFADLGDGLIVADIEPTRAKREELEEEFGTLFVSTHYLLPLSLSEDGKSMTIWMLNSDRLQAALESGAIETPWAEHPEGGILLTGTTKQIQDLMRTVRGNERLFDKETLVRTEGS